jgi:protein TonB
VPQIASPAVAVATLSPQRPFPTPQADDESSAAEIDAYVRYLWGMIAARRPAGVHMEGAIGIAFRLDRDGNIVSAEVVNSSGDPMLDRLALKTVQRAAPFPSPPQAAGTAPSFTIQFHFR